MNSKMRWNRWHRRTSRRTAQEQAESRRKRAKISRLNLIKPRKISWMANTTASNNISTYNSWAFCAMKSWMNSVTVTMTVQRYWKVATVRWISVETLKSAIITRFIHVWESTRVKSAANTFPSQLFRSPVSISLIDSSTVKRCCCQRALKWKIGRDDRHQLEKWKTKSQSEDY